jgi:hypothetical protein
MPFVDFDPAQPDGSVDNGSAALADVRNNQGALRIYLALGLFWGYTYAQSGGSAAQPTTITLTKGTTIIRFTLTWGTTGGENNQPKTILTEVSTNSGGAYDSVGTVTNTYDSGGELTSTTGGGGFLSKLWSLWGLVRKVIADLATHIAATGTGVHGLGTMSTQAANNVAVTGGSIDGASVGLTTENTVRAKRWADKLVSNGATSGSVTLDFTAAASIIQIINGVTTFAFTTSIPSNSAIFYTLQVSMTGAYAVTWPSMYWIGSAPPATLPAGEHMFQFYHSSGALKGTYLGVLV